MVGSDTQIEKAGDGSANVAAMVLVLLIVIVVLLVLRQRAASKALPSRTA